MKRRLVALVLFLGAVTSRVSYGDTWIPGAPKPIESPESWITDVTGFFCDLWTFFLY